MRKLGTIGVALLGLWALLQLATLLSWPMTVLVYSNEWSLPIVWVTAIAFVPAVVSAALGAALIGRRRQIAARLFDDAECDASVTAPDLMRGGIIFFGLALVLQALVGLIRVALDPTVQVLMNAVVYDGFADFGPGYVWISNLPSLVVLVVEFVVGVWFLARSGPIATRLWIGRRSTAAVSPDPVGSSRCPNCGAPFDPEDYDWSRGTVRCVECKEVLENPHA